MHRGGEGCIQHLCWEALREEIIGSPRCRWEDNIKMDLGEIRFVDVDWIHLAQDRDRWRGSCEHSDEPSSSIKCREFLDY
jgi:hypothetical protein